ncbi:hypothetical protein, partial [Paraburkholderia madseniana]|uniref:hypothetical protein n=1 Tax=Paraburkholderia madseniana TaxID=2599607 RepID=UPI001412E40F
LVTELNADLKGPLGDAGVCVTRMLEACGRRDSAQLERWLVDLLAIVDELRARVQRLDVFCRRDAGVFGVVTLRAAVKEALWIVGARHGALAQRVRLAVSDDHVWCNAERLVLLVVSVLDHLLRRQGGAHGSIEIGSRVCGDGVDLLVSFDGEVVDDALLAPPLEQLMRDAAESRAPGLELMIAAEAALAMNTRLGSRVDDAGRGEYRVHLVNPKAASEAAANGVTQRPAGVGV